VLGCDVGGSAVKWAVLSDEAVVACGERPTPLTGAVDVVGALAEICREAAPLDGIGVGMPGVVDSERGEVILLPNLVGDWSGYPLAHELEERSGVPVRLNNDARNFALAEWRLGAARGHQDALFLTLGTGVGGGVVVNGRLHLGPGGHGGELGHQSVDPQGPRCGCGARGCVEVYASGPAIASAAVHGVLQGLPTSLRAASGGLLQAITPKLVAAEAARGDRVALEALEAAATALGRGIASASVVLEPEMVVIGGGLAPCFDLIAPTVRAVLAQQLRLFAPPRVVRAALGRHGGAMGAALWARYEVESPT
jgi:glucokinase